MNKNIVLCAMLLMCTLLFSACQSNSNPYTPLNDGQNVFGGTQQTQQQPQQQQGSAGMLSGLGQGAKLPEEPDYDSGEYDPTSEEEPDSQKISTIPDQAPAFTSAPSMNSNYAGATPVVIDPIDKPTPTPVPPITFAYQVYDATNVGLTFEGPAGWTVDASQKDTYMLVNPAPGMAYPAQIIIRVVPVDQKYDQKALEQVVKNMLDSTGSEGFRSYSPTRTATRTLMDAAGVYADYNGTLQNGARVYGRIHATCIDKVLYTVHISYPYDYREAYKDNVYAQLRKTMTIVK